MGSAALCELAKRGVNALGLDQFGRAHDQGSSHGASRIFRKGYFEHPDYVPLLHRSAEMWAELQGGTDKTVFTPCELVMAGTANGDLITGLKACYAAHDLPHERLDVDTARERFPAFAFADDDVAYVDPEAAVVNPENAVDVHLLIAQRHGAEVRIHSRGALLARGR